MGTFDDLTGKLDELKDKTTNIVLHILNSVILYIVIKLNIKEIRNKPNKALPI